MDLVNKFYSSVSQLSSQVSQVLPGVNAISREFDQHEQICSAGIGLLWKVYKGTKKSTKQLCSIFIFDKKQLEKFQKDDREQILEILRKGILQLTKIRHPQVLHVEHPLEETTNSIMFVTEPVFGSLANVLGNSFNMGIPIKYKLHDIEIKYGLMQLCEGLRFLHSECKLIHRNICPESIIINQQGAWKIFGFDYCVLVQNPLDPQLFWPFIEYNPSWHNLTQPSLEYMAPENVLISKYFPSSDIFSLGILIYSVFSSGKPPKMFGRDFAGFKRYANDLKKGTYPDLRAIPDGLIDQTRLMLNATPEIRPNIYEFTKISYFDDVGVKTLSYLDSLFQWDNLQKSKFFKGLPQIISKLPNRINLYRVLPCLVKEFVNPSMIPFLLPNILLIAEGCTNDDYEKHILVHLKPIMKIQEPVQILLIFMQKMDLLLKMTPSQDIKTDVLPMLYRALESDSQQIQELCLSILPTFASLVDYPSIKNAVLPRIKKLCVTTNSISVRVNCLLCISKLLDYLDKWLVLDEIIPFLGQIPSREPAVLMGITGILKLCLTSNKLGVTKEVLASKVIPFMVPLCIENGLSLSQFNAMMTLVKTMIDKVENEHRTKLEQLATVQKEAKYLQTQHNTITSPTKPTQDLNDAFSDFGLEKFLNDLEDETSKTENTFRHSASAGTLNLQEKQRLAQQQQLQPTAAKSMQLPKPKDLTSSLLESNLNQLKFTHNSDAKRQQPPTTSNPTFSQSVDWNDSNWQFNDLSTSQTKRQSNVPMMAATKSSSLLMQHSIPSAPQKPLANPLTADDIMDFLK